MYSHILTYSSYNDNMIIFYFIILYVFNIDKILKTVFKWIDKLVNIHRLFIYSTKSPGMMLTYLYHNLLSIVIIKTCLLQLYDIFSEVENV